MPSASIHAAFSDELALASRKLRTLFDARARASGLTLPRARTLVLLAQADKMTQTEIADSLDVEGPTLVRLLDGLEGQGLIRRCAVDGDRRAKQIALTEPGRKLAAEVRHLADRIRAEVMADIPDSDLEAATRLLRQVSQRIEAAGSRAETS
jgi:MarR family transcriptional regulator, transcriptional regulator for hemolysin